MLPVVFFLLLFVNSGGAFLSKPKAFQQTVVLYESPSPKEADKNNLAVALILPSSPENPILQDSANQIIAKLPCSACAEICNTPEADTACRKANAVIALGVASPFDVRFVATAFRWRRSSSNNCMDTCQFALGGKPFAPLVGAYDEANPNWKKDVPFTAEAQDCKLMLEMQALFGKGEIEDYVQAIGLFLKAKQV